MLLDIAHKKLPVYKASAAFVKECFLILDSIGNEDRRDLCRQIRRAAVSIQLNIAEGCSKRTTAERRRYFEIARGSLVEVDAGIDILLTLNHLDEGIIEKLRNLANTCFQQLSNLINALNKEINS